MVVFAGESLGLEGSMWGMKSWGREAGADSRRNPQQIRGKVVTCPTWRDVTEG